MLSATSNDHRNQQSMMSSKYSRRRPLPFNPLRFLAEVLQEKANIRKEIMLKEAEELRLK
jgi:hypothetical protein